MGIAADRQRQRLEVSKCLSERPAIQSICDPGNLNDAITWHRAHVRQNERACEAFAAGRTNLQRLAGIERRHERDDRRRWEIDISMPLVGMKQRLLTIEGDAFEMRADVGENRRWKRREEPV